jgi:hypothetical protein
MPQENIAHTSYAISQQDMLQTWIDMLHADENIVVMHDPGKHLPYLTKMGFGIPEEEMWRSKVLLVQTDEIDNAMWIVKNVRHDIGPYCQVWIKGRYITDNIDH